jgi:tRNA 2-thiouridine synthesizing protein A
MTSSSSSSSLQPGSLLGEQTDVVDVCGEVCPYTFVRTKLALEALPIGARLRVLTDHEPAVRNIPRSAQEWGQEVVGTEALGDGQWVIDLIKRVR